MKDSLSLAILGLLGICGLVVAGVCMSGYTLSVLWGWFVVPLFHLPALSIPTAIGLSCVVGYMTKQEDFKKGEEESFAFKISYAITKPLFFLLIGWIAKQYM